MKRYRYAMPALALATVITAVSGCGGIDRTPGSSATPASSTRLEIASGSAEPSRPDVAGSATVPVPNVDVAGSVHDVRRSITVGAAVFDRERDTRLLAHNADRQFRAASVVKLLIAIDALQRAPDNAARVRRMLVHSDNQIASTLWVRGGGEALVRRMSERIGLSDTETPNTPGRWGNVLLSARDVATVYRYVLNEAPATTRETIVRALADTTRLASDGWYQHFGIPDGIGQPWAVKQGWSNSSDDLVVHTTGLAGKDYRYIVVLLLEDGLSTSWGTLRKAATVAAKEAAPLVKDS